MTSHAIVDHWCDDCNKKWLGRKLVWVKHVVIELLTTASLATWLIVSLARRVGRPSTTFRIFSLLHRCFIMDAMSLNQNRQVHAHILGKVGTTCILLHNSSPGVVL